MLKYSFNCSQLDPATQLVGPSYPEPPHWPYHGTVDAAQAMLMFLRVRIPGLG